MNKFLFILLSFVIFAVMLLAAENNYFENNTQEPDNGILMLLSGVLVLVAAVVGGTQKASIGFATVLVCTSIELWLFGVAAYILSWMFTLLLAAYITNNKEVHDWISKIWREEEK